MNTVPLIECITTWQGEGPDTGKKMLLTRFKSCNLSCSFCDTQVKMRNSVVGNYSLDLIQTAINSINGGLMITGGEPTLYAETTTMLEDLIYSVANVETNGKRLIDLLTNDKLKDKNIKYIFSPKNDHFEEVLNGSITTKKATNVIYNHEKVYVKLLISDYNEYISMIKSYIKKITSSLAYGFDSSRLYLMPMGTTYEELKENSKRVFDLAEEYKCNISSRLHLMYNFL